MNKKSLFLLPCIAAVAIATFVGTKALKSNASESNALLMANVEALSAETEDSEERRNCVNNGGNWNMALCCVDGGTVTKTCEVKGEITVFGVTVKGEWKKGQTVTAAWERWSCVASTGNCCKISEQGVRVKV